MENLNDACLTAEAARTLGLTCDGVRWLARRGVLHAIVTTGGVRLFSRAEVRKLALARLDGVRRQDDRPGESTEPRR